MKQKEKKVLIYLFATIYYFLCFMLYIFFITVFGNLEYTSYNNQTLVLFRDISMVMYYLNYIFIVIAFIRGFGFNIKQFNFSKDLMELDISEADREEIEVGSGIDYENVSNFIRRRKRNFLYYLKENSFILTLFLGIILIYLGARFSISYFVTNKVYNMGDIINIENVNYRINNCYILNTDFEGHVIKEKKNYAIIDLNVYNANKDDTVISSANHRLKVDNKYYYPKTNVGDVFNDFGIIYKQQTLKSDVNNKFILVYEIDNNYENIMLELFVNKEEKNNEIKVNYKPVNIKPYEFKEANLGEYKFGQVVNLNKTYYQEGMFSILNMEIIPSDTYKYSKCVTEDKCYEYEKDIVPNRGYKILKINYTLDINKEIFNYLRINDKSLLDITPSNYEENYKLLEIPSDTNEESIVLDFNIRGIKFNITK